MRAGRRGRLGGVKEDLMGWVEGLGVSVERSGGRVGLGGRFEGRGGMG